jgi:hypothetical protein
MGVLIVKFPVKTKEGLVERGKKILLEAVNSFFNSAGNFGTEVCEVGTCFWKNN